MRHSTSGSHSQALTLRLSLSASAGLFGSCRTVESFTASPPRPHCPSCSEPLYYTPRSYLMRRVDLDRAAMIDGTNRAGFILQQAQSALRSCFILQQAQSALRSCLEATKKSLRTRCSRSTTCHLQQSPASIPGGARVGSNLTADYKWHSMPGCSVGTFRSLPCG